MSGGWLVGGDPDNTAPEPTRDPLEPSTTATVVRDWGAATSVGLVRQRNEDRWVHIGRAAFSVADGMGGYEGGDLAAASAVEGFAESAGASTSRSETAWRHIVWDLNRRVRATLRTAGLDVGGTTFVAVILDGDLATVLNVGDSRVFRMRRGQLDQLTSDHTLATEMRAAGVHSGEGGLVRALTSYLGIADELLRVDVASYEVRSGDCLMLCSDGVHEQVPTDMIAAVLGGASSAAHAARMVVAEADALGGRDNATAVIVRF